jgi:hypothetical protein
MVLVRRYLAQKGQLTIDGGCVGVDGEQELNPDFARYAATLRYSLPELKAAFEAGVKHVNSADVTEEFETFLDEVIAKKNSQKPRAVRRKRSNQAK